MARILFSWELGGALGHLATIGTLCERLHALGHDVHLAVDPTKVPRSILGATPITCHAMPGWRPLPMVSGRAVRTYAHIMRNVGYGDRKQLAAQLQAHRRLLVETRPDVLVCDASPTALLAARGLDIPTVSVGTGLAIPPRSYPLPDLHFWDPMAAASWRDDEDALITGINEATSAAGCGTVQRLHELFHTTLTAIASVPELDHYPHRSLEGCNGGYVGEIGRLRGLQADWPGNAAQRVFIYVKNFPELPQLLRHLQRRGVSALIYGTDLPPDLMRQFASDRLRHVQQPLDVAYSARTASLFVTNASHGLTLRALQLGLPVLGFPLTLDNHAVARNVEAIGAGKHCSPWGSDRIAATLDALLDDPSYARHARAFAERYRHLDPEVQVPLLATRISALVN